MIWELFFANSAEEALCLVVETTFDAIITDMHMPGMSGLELLQKLSESESTRSIPVMMVTGEETES